jgi:hypothetical protein
MLSLHAAETSSSESGTGSDSVESGTKIFTMDRIYKSMFGPAEINTVTLLETEEPEVLWITAIRSDTVGADGETPESPEYFCHSVLARRGKSQVERMRQLGLSVRNLKLFTLVQGLNEIRFPQGFGIPAFSNEQFDIIAMVMNPAEPEEPVHVGIDSRVEYIRASKLDQEMAPLFIVPLVLKVPVEGPDTDHSTHQHGGDETCLADDSDSVIVTSVEEPISVNQSGLKDTGHWYVPPGRHVYRYRLERLDRRIQFDTKVHYIASHLHPFGESLELIDLTTGKSVFKATAHNYPDRVAIEEITHYSSREGMKIERSHEHELVAVYNNTTEHDVDSMAVMYLYLQDTFRRETLKLSK